MRGVAGRIAIGCVPKLWLADVEWQRDVVAILAMRQWFHETDIRDLFGNPMVHAVRVSDTISRPGDVYGMKLGFSSCDLYSDRKLTVAELDKAFGPILRMMLTALENPASVVSVRTGTDALSHVQRLGSVGRLVRQSSMRVNIGNVVTRELAGDVNVSWYSMGNQAWYLLVSGVAGSVRPGKVCSRFIAVKGTDEAAFMHLLLDYSASHANRVAWSSIWHIWQFLRDAGSWEVNKFVMGLYLNKHKIEEENDFWSEVAHWIDKGARPIGDNTRYQNKIQGLIWSKRGGRGAGYHLESAMCWMLSKRQVFWCVYSDALELWAVGLCVAI
jgi:hypothetical protein